jgi:hypothetical protein
MVQTTKKMAKQMTSHVITTNVFILIGRLVLRGFQSARKLFPARSDFRMWNRRSRAIIQHQKKPPSTRLTAKSHAADL